MRSPRPVNVLVRLPSAKRQMAEYSHLIVARTSEALDPQQPYTGAVRALEVGDTSSMINRSGGVRAAEAPEGLSC
jgi:hypothetical protein